MKYVTKTSKKSPVGITPVTLAEYEKAIKKLPAHAQSHISCRRTPPEIGDYVYVTNEKSKLNKIFAIIEEGEIDIWTFSDLPKKLPKSEYEFLHTFTPEQATWVAAGWELGTYNYTEYKKPTNNFPSLLAPKNCSYAEAESLATSISLARDLINMPPSDLTPQSFAKKAAALAKNLGAKISILHDAELLKAGYESIYTVGKGSENRPCLLDIRWGKKSAPKVTLVGKGVTFDTGGLNLKGEANMRWMKKDMGGAAIVLALGKTITEMNLPVNLRVLIPLVENSVSGSSFRPSDIIRTRVGITVEVENTDAEGRLILCEPLAEADAEKPDLLIDIATLTGAARTAVGTEIAAYFCPSDKLAAELEKSASHTKDAVWRLPLWEDYKKMLASKFADLMNTPETGNGGAITAALFLKEFVKTTKNWIHLDLMAWNTRPRAGRPVGGEAMAFRALYDLIKRKYS